MALDDYLPSREGTVNERPPNDPGGDGGDGDDGPNPGDNGTTDLLNQQYSGREQIRQIAGQAFQLIILLLGILVGSISFARSNQEVFLQLFSTKAVFYVVEGAVTLTAAILICSVIIGKSLHTIRLGTDQLNRRQIEYAFAKGVTGSPQPEEDAYVRLHNENYEATRRLHRENQRLGDYLTGAITLITLAVCYLFLSIMTFFFVNFSLITHWVISVILLPMIIIPITIRASIFDNLVGGREEGLIKRINDELGIQYEENSIHLNSSYPPMENAIGLINFLLEERQVGLSIVLLSGSDVLSPHPTVLNNPKRISDIYRLYITDDLPDQVYERLIKILIQRAQE